MQQEGQASQRERQQEGHQRPTERMEASGREREQEGHQRLTERLEASEREQASERERHQGSPQRAQELPCLAARRK